MASTSTSKNLLEEFPKYNDSVYGLHIPSNIQLGSQKAEVIFFHDIQWTGCTEPHIESWMSNTKPQVCWPKAWLPNRYPAARVWSARYDAGRWKGERTGHMDLHLLAENLRQDILSVCRESCPVFLVGHGLGGLVIKALIKEVQDRINLCVMGGSTYQEEEVHKLDCFLKNVKGILYFATPFLGTRLADSEKDSPHHGSMWKYLVNYLGKDSPHHGSMWKHLSTMNRETCKLNDWFRVWRTNASCKTTLILATLPTTEHLWYENWCTPRCTLVVEEAAARYDVDDVYSSGTNHFTVCKLCDEKDSSFQRLIELMDPEMQVVTRGHVAKVKESDKSLCSKYVAIILSQLQTLAPGDGLCIPREIAEKIRNVPEVWEDLSGSLMKAGLAKTDENADAECWEQVYREL